MSSTPPKKTTANTTVTPEKKKTGINKYVPHLITVGALLLIALLYNYPQLQGKVLKQGDVVSWQAMAHEAKTYYENTGETPLWTNSMFGGMPTYTFYLGGANNYVWYIQNFFEGVLGKPTVFLFLAMMCFYILMRVWRVNRWLAAIGAIAYAFATYNPVIISAGHDTKMYTIAYMPAVLAGFLLLYRGRWWMGTGLMALFFALVIINSHYQMVFYLLIILGFAWIGQLVKAAKEKDFKTFGIATLISILIGVLCIGPSMPSILTTKEYAKESIRGGQSELTLNKDANEVKTGGGLDKGYAFQWSNEIGETFSLMIPGLYGGGSYEELGENSNLYETVLQQTNNAMAAEQVAAQAPMYWGEQPFLEGPIYFGAIICFLFVLGMVIIRSPHKWWILAVCVLAIVMSWGRHFAAFNYFLFDTVPMLNNFRTPSMVLTIPQLLFPFVAVWALCDIIREGADKERLWKGVKVATIATAGLCVLLAFGAGMFFDFTSQLNDPQMLQTYTNMLGNEQVAQQLMGAVRDDRADMAMKSGLISALFIVLAAGLLWAYLKGKANAMTMMAGIGILIFIDLVPTATEYLNEDDFVEESEYEAIFQPRLVDTRILQDPDPYYRVLDLSTNVYNDAKPAYYHKLVGGYNAAKMERYQDLIDVHMSGRFNAEVLDMLNTKYVIYQGQNGQPDVFVNPDANGNAWFVEEVKWVNSADEEMLAMKSHPMGDTSMKEGDFNSRTTAIMRTEFKDELGNYQFGKDSAASVKLAQYGLNEISYTSNNSRNGLAVFSDIYYPLGWKAFIDGQEVPILKANYVLRALKVPAGQHNIVFKFEPQSFKTGNTIGMISSILLFGVVGFAFFMGFRKEQKEDAPASEK